MSTESKVPTAGGDSEPVVAKTLGDGTAQRAEVDVRMWSEPALGRRRRRSLQGAFVFAYAFCLLLVGYGIYRGGVWNILANTRLLDTLIDAGLVAYTDQQMGIVEGLPDLELYLLAQTPIHWEVLAFVGIFYAIFYLLKMVQFHTIARFYGLKGSLGSHARAYFYGQGLHRLLPYGAGDVAVVKALEGQGEDPRRASSVVHVQDMFVWFEITFFFLVGVVLTGWEMSFLQILWPAVFFGIFWYATRGQRYTAESETPEARDAFRRVLRAFSTQPRLLVGLCVLSVFCFFVDDVTPYLTGQALTSGEVILHVPFLVIQGGVVAGYLASRIPITPGGIGQFEFGFGTALMMAGTGFATSMTIVLVDGLFRHGVPLLMFAVARVWHGIETNMSEVLARFAEVPEPAPAAEAISA